MKSYDSTLKNWLNKEKDGVSLFKVSIGPYYRKEYLIRLQETINIIGITGTKIVVNEVK